MSRRIGRASGSSQSIAFLGWCERQAAAPIRIAPTSKAKRSKGSPKDCPDVGAGEPFAPPLEPSGLDTTEVTTGRISAATLDTAIGGIKGHVEPTINGLESPPAATASKGDPMVVRFLEQYGRDARELGMMPPLPVEPPWQHAPAIRQRIANFHRFQGTKAPKGF